MRVEVINTGTEILLGAVLNTHQRFLAERLAAIGLKIQRQCTVPDGPPIFEELLAAFRRADVILVTGGLGPTTDDVTREAVADLLGVEMVEDPDSLAAIVARFARRSITLPDRAGRQAMRPEVATVLKNPHGTAPGLYIPPTPAARLDGALSPHIFLLPGPPRELHPMVDGELIPILKTLAPQSAEITHTLRIIGVGESAVEKAVGAALIELGIDPGYCARPYEVDVRLVGDQAKVEAGTLLVRAAFAAEIVSEDGSSLEETVIRLFLKDSLTLATAESCTGGQITSRLTDVPGSSGAVMAGYITYSNEAKMRDLEVAESLLAEHGAVSEPVAAAMATGARKRAGTDSALSITGIAGPGGGSPMKPVGTVFMAVDHQGAVTVVKHFFPTDRANFKSLATHAALDLLRRVLLGLPTGA